MTRTHVAIPFGTDIAVHRPFARARMETTWQLLEHRQPPRWAPPMNALKVAKPRHRQIAGSASFCRRRTSPTKSVRSDVQRGGRRGLCKTLARSSEVGTSRQDFKISRFFGLAWRGPATSTFFFLFCPAMLGGSGRYGRRCPATRPRWTSLRGRRLPPRQCKPTLRDTRGETLRVLRA